MKQGANSISASNFLMCRLNDLDLSSEIFAGLKGVYIIWSGQETIRLGSGLISDRLKAHRDDPKINKYPNLLVTWAKVNGTQMEGVEKFLSDKLSPIVGERFPDRTPIPVNLPW